MLSLSKGSERIVLVLAGLLIAALLCIAYLLGRLSGVPSSGAEQEASLAARRAGPSDPGPGLLPPPPARARSPAVPTPEPRDPTEPTRGRDGDGRPLIENEAAQGAPPGPNDAARGLAPRPEGVAPPGRRESARTESGADQVEKYFARVKAIEVQGSGEARDMAQTLLSSFMQGDTSGFDGLVANLEASERTARSIDPPADCRDYHEQLLGVLRDSRRLLTEVKAALAKGDASGLGALTASANSVQSRAEALNTLEARIRRSKNI